MRLLGYLLLLLLLTAAGWLGLRQLPGLWRPGEPAPALLQGSDLPHQSASVYFPDSEQWLTFPLVSQPEHVRVLSHVAASASTPEDQPLQYSLRYQLLDEDLAVLQEGSWTHRTRIPPALLHQGRLLPHSLYADSSLRVASGQDFILQLAGLPTAHYLRLRLQPLEPPLLRVAARVYYEERLTPARAAVVWERLSQDNRDALTRDLIYPPALSLPEERRNLLQRQWQPVGPLETGARQGRLYTLDTREIAQETGSPVVEVRNGRFVAPQRYAVLPIVEAGEYQIDFTPAVPVSAPNCRSQLAGDPSCPRTKELAAEAAPVKSAVAGSQPRSAGENEAMDPGSAAAPTQNATLQLTWYSERVEQPPELSLPLDAHGSLRRTLEPGLLLVRASQPGRIELHAVSAPGDSLLPPPSNLRTQRLRENAPVVFTLSPSEQGSLPLRLDLRAWSESRMLPASLPLAADYRLFDADNRQIGAGQLRASSQPSAFDYLPATPEQQDLSDPASFYLRLPGRTARVEVSLPPPAPAQPPVTTTPPVLLVNAWTRPADLPHRTRVPQDYYLWSSDPMMQPGWFILRPPEVTAADAELAVQVQPRPPQRDPQLLAGRFLWQALEPQLNARGARLLLPLQPDDAVRPSALPVYYSPLASGSQTVELQTALAATPLRPQLLYLRDSAQPFNLQLNIGGQMLRQSLSGRRGLLPLPALPPGRHPLQLSSDGNARWLLNQRMPGPGSYQLRLGYALERTPLQFSLQRPAGQRRLVGARFYASDAGSTSATATHIRLRVQPATALARLPLSELQGGPSSRWTHSERIYELTPPPRQALTGYLLDQQQGRVAEGLPLLFELADDLPAGPLQLSFERLDGSPGYLVFYEIIPGEPLRVDSFQEIRP